MIHTEFELLLDWGFLMQTRQNNMFHIYQTNFFQFIVQNGHLCTKRIWFDLFMSLFGRSKCILYAVQGIFGGSNQCIPKGSTILFHYGLGRIPGGGGILIFSVRQYIGCFHIVMLISILLATNCLLLGSPLYQGYQDTSQSQLKMKIKKHTLALRATQSMCVNE